LVQSKIEFWIVPTWLIFEKSSHLREKGGVLMLFKTTRQLLAKAQYACTTAVVYYYHAIWAAPGTSTKFSTRQAPHFDFRMHAYCLFAGYTISSGNYLGSNTFNIHFFFQVGTVPKISANTLLC
jgi:hypothetical protein